ncbi:MAG: glycosyltransferase [Actinomycetia bacterium]|nr:glycosyltransferase [Actinomycetes bacterium]MCH9800660.1 glycosyltransferase [Actinomycetes bacterium]
MKVVMLAPVHRYDDVRVFRKEAVTLAQAGHRVILYARTPDDEPRLESGVEVRPVRYRGRLQRFAKLPGLGRAALRERAEIYHVHNPDTLPVAFWLRLQGHRVIYDSHEDFRTELLLRRWLPGLIRRPAAAAISRAEAWAGRVLAAVIVTQEQIRRRIPQATLIGNPPLVSAAAIADALAGRAERSTGETITLGYVGGISEDRGLSRMLELTAAMNELHPTRLKLIGYPVNDDALQGAMARPEWSLVDYLGELAQPDAFAQLATVDAGLILFTDVASHRHIDPNKIYEYMAHGVPFVASDFPEWRARLQAADAGIFVSERQTPTIAAVAVLEMLADPEKARELGRNGAAFVQQHYSWQSTAAPVLLNLYRRLSSRPAVSSRKSVRQRS